MEYNKGIFSSQPLNCSDSSFRADDGSIIDNRGAANAFGSFFSTAVHNLEEKSLPLVNYVWRYRNSFCTRNNLSFNFTPVSTKLVEKKLKQLKRSKAAGIDNIPPGILKDCSTVVKTPLAHILNLSLITGEIPQEWKKTKVIPLHINDSVCS